MVWSDLFRPVFTKMGPTPNRLNTWEQLFEFYMAGSAVARAHAITYMDPGSQWNAAAKKWPASDPADKDSIITWLIGQLGNRAGATQYYNNAYRGNLAAVLADAKAIGI
jgi:hypothetical protein